MVRKQVKSGGAGGGTGGGAGTGGNKQWESALTAAPLEEDGWSVCVSMVVCNSKDDEVWVRALSTAVQQPLRRTFTLLSWEKLLHTINELGNPKTRKVKELPTFCEVMEVAKSALDAGEELTVDLLAKLVKVQLLTIKSNDLLRRSTLQRGVEEKTKAGSASSAKASAKGERSKRVAEAPAPTKGTTLRRRGEEENVSTYVDDEPDDGPQNYVLMTGLHQPHLISALDSLGVHVSNVIRLRSEPVRSSDPAQDVETPDTPEQQESQASVPQQELDEFWDQLDGVLNSAGFQSRLSDIAKLDYTVDQNLQSRDFNSTEELAVGAAVFDGVACLLYDSLDWRRQHQHYLNNLKLIHVPTISTTEPDHATQPATHHPSQDVCVCVCYQECVGGSVDVDMRLYSHLLDRIPSEMVSVPLVLHCILQQVEASQQEDPAGSVGSDQGSDPERELTLYMLSAVMNLARPDQEKTKLLEDFKLQKEHLCKEKQEGPVLLHHHDETSRRLHFLPVDGVDDVVDVEKSMMEKSTVWNTLMSKHLNTNSLNAARKHELLHFCSSDSLSSTEVTRLLQMYVFESMPLTTVDHTGGLTSAPSSSPLPWDDPVTFSRTIYSTLNRTDECKVGGEEQQEEITVSAEDLQKILIRGFRHWNYTEHHNPNVFPQVLQKASESYRSVDSFYSSLHSAVFLICHNLMNAWQSSRDSWEVSLHTDVRFRSYLEHVAESIKEWTTSEETKLQNLTEMKREEAQSQPSGTEGPSVESSAEDRTESYIRQESLKAWKLEQDRLKEEETSKLMMKKDQGGKSSSKAGQRTTSIRESRKSREDENNTPHSAEVLKDERTIHPPPENPNVITGYSMDGRLVRMKGENQYLYPSDGGEIHVESVHHVQGSTQLKVCVRKDGHRFYTHVTRPESPNSTASDQQGAGEGRGFHAVLKNGIRLSYTRHRHQPLIQQVPGCEDVDDAPLNLNVSLPTGLQIHFKHQHTADGWTVLVRQLLPPAAGSSLPNSESSRTITNQGVVIKHLRDGSTEVLFPDGTVCVGSNSETESNTSAQEEEIHTDTHNSDNGVEVEGAEPAPEAGLREQVVVSGGSWCTTAPSGTRIRTIGGIQVEEKPVLTYCSTDPHSHSLLITRDDRVRCVFQRDGSAVVDHADRTRITSSYQQRAAPTHHSSEGQEEEKMVTVEQSRFTTVMMKSEERSCELLIRDGTTIRTSAHGSYQVLPSDGGVLLIRGDGAAVYSSDDEPATGPEGNQPGQYTMSPSADVVCSVTDSGGKRYEVTAEGGVTVTPPEDPPPRPETEPQHPTGFNTHPPRLFVVYPDGSAVEFLSAGSVEEVLEQENTDPSTAVIREPVTHTHETFTTTILKPLSGDLISSRLSPRHLDDITPPHLRSRRWDTFPAAEMTTPGPGFGLSLGRGLQLRNTPTPCCAPAPPVLQNPDTLLVRRLTEHTPLTTQLHQHLQEKLLVYINQLLLKEKLREELKVKDPRSLEEKHQSDLLMSRVDPVYEDPEDLTPQSALSVYSQTIDASQCPDSDPQDDESAHGLDLQKRESEWRNRIHQHRSDLQEEKRHRHALRNHLVTPYFSPELSEMNRYTHQDVDLEALSRDLPPFSRRRRNTGVQTEVQTSSASPPHKHSE
ncbi:sperm-associated antigen 17 isoform X2 [Trichomycterus rosablanca]|uniref:sperm-associated antigen 17 isoform X2 n=1 Tax=Trichomycterus rosablanca TaxID=2290929 RepID=UPI002F35D5C6